MLFAKRALRFVGRSELAYHSTQVRPRRKRAWQANPLRARPLKPLPERLPGFPAILRRSGRPQFLQSRFHANGFFSTQMKRIWNLPFLFCTVILEWNASVMVREVITFPIAPWDRISPSANINALSKQGKISST